ncbi:putative HD phosphohydrolase [Rhodococcus sp. SMB37]|jgi:predicted HD phosphohydrolase|uniref:HD domain-containing protein n=1 Tax=Rhodococcus sp. SMB37 TaxID=2512213 RepID=UPI0006D20D77|nr:HD domain-containing protein [Rhodococcus sp. SMB37]TCN47340.1 putative HD phosphohydrolase [Rhodococcus sp. SMB37]
MVDNTRTVEFSRMDDATAAEMELIRDEAAVHRRDHWLATVVRLLESMKGYTFGYRVDRYEHSLQSATRAHREGARVDLVVAALLHDIGDDLCPDNHSEVAAAILRPVLDDEAVWIVKHHGVFQTYHYGDKLGIPTDSRDRYRDSPYFDTCAHFCGAWDQESFDPDYDTEPLEFFMPMLEEVFSRPPRTWGDQDLVWSKEVSGDPQSE